MGDVNIQKVTALPPLLQRRADTVYIVPEGSDGVKVYITGRSPTTLRHLPTSEEIIALVGDLGGTSDPGDLTLVFDNHLI